MEKQCMWDLSIQNMMGNLTFFCRRILTLANRLILGKCNPPLQSVQLSDHPIRGRWSDSVVRHRASLTAPVFTVDCTSYE